MFLAAIGEGGYLRWRVLAGAGRTMDSALGIVFMVIGAIFGLFVAAYTGVLLAVSNQPVWSDTWTLGGLFLASGLSGAAASILLLNRRGRDAAVTDGKLMEADRYFIILELVLIALFLITLGGLVSKVLGGGWIILWLIVLIGTLVPLVAEWRPRMVAGSSRGHHLQRPGLDEGRGHPPLPVRGSRGIPRGRARDGSRRRGQHMDGGRRRPRPVAGAGGDRSGHRPATAGIASELRAPAQH
ncbi:MAG: hypothetical protein E6I78_11380, partial [Chloroflexi bacterium]